jgi:hypothetical protein
MNEISELKSLMRNMRTVNVKRTNFLWVTTLTCAGNYMLKEAVVLNSYIIIILSTILDMNAVLWFQLHPPGIGNRCMGTNCKGTNYTNIFITKKGLKVHSRGKAIGMNV